MPGVYRRMSEKSRSCVMKKRCVACVALQTCGSILPVQALHINGIDVMAK